MKKYFVLLFALFISIFAHAYFIKNVDEKLLRSFKETFPNAEQVSWSEMTETYVVNFVESGIRSRITFGKHGEYLGSIRYYGESHLPPFLVFYLKSQFPDKKIFGITEVSTACSIAYYVKMEDPRLWTTIKIDDETNWEYVEKYKKALL